MNWQKPSGLRRITSIMNFLSTLKHLKSKVLLYPLNHVVMTDENHTTENVKELRHASVVIGNYSVTQVIKRSLSQLQNSAFIACLNSEPKLWSVLMIEFCLSAWEARTRHIKWLHLDDASPGANLNARRRGGRHGGKLQRFRVLWKTCDCRLFWWEKREEIESLKLQQ